MSGPRIPSTCRVCRHWTAAWTPNPRTPWDTAARPVWGTCTVAEDGVATEVTHEHHTCPAWAPRDHADTP
jgi:hypothetical protein